MSKHQIQIGDLVCVNFNNAQYTLASEARVLYVPCATGDSWQFQDINSEEIHYVSEGCTISLIEKQNQSDSGT